MSEATDWRGRRVLLTGATGFIGGAVARRLAAQGAEVHAVSRREPQGGGGGARWWRGDLAEPQQTAQIVGDAGPDTILHLASHVSGARELERVQATFAANLASAVNLLVAAAEHGRPRVVLAGSLEEPAAGERADAVPGSPYAAAKWAASAYARMFHALYDLPVVVARIFMVYGPGQRDRTKLVPYTILSLLRGEVPRLSSGERPVDWIYVEDVAEGLLRLAARAGELAGLQVDLGSGELVTVRTVVETLAEIIGGGLDLGFGALADRPLEAVRRADVEATAERLGWRAATPLRQGLERTVAWYSKRS